MSGDFTASVEDGTGGDQLSSSLGPNALLTCKAPLCLVCNHLSRRAYAACRAYKSCASAMGTVESRSVDASSFSGIWRLKFPRRARWARSASSLAVLLLKVSLSCTLAANARR